MANPEHLEVVKQGLDAWNAWRAANPEVRPDLSGADVPKVNLRGADLRGASLRKARFREGTLRRVDLRKGNLREASLWGANLRDADLREADLRETELTYAQLAGANLTGARLGDTVFGATNLSEARGLDQCAHFHPSILDFRTLVRSGSLPLLFLRGCGVPEPFIKRLGSLRDDPDQYPDCFLSHSTVDKEFIERLYDDLQSKGVRCWYAPEDLKIGDQTLDAIDGAIRMRDKVLLVLSEASIASGLVKKEVTRADAEERRRGKNVLMPIRIDDAVEHTHEAWAALLWDGRNIGEFRNWKDHDAYQKNFARLLRDLKGDEPKAAEA